MFWGVANSVPILGGRILSKKVPNFVPTGRVIKYPTKCAFFGLPARPGRTGQGRSWGGYPGLPGGAPGHPLPGLRIGGYRGVSWEGGVPIVGLPVVARLPGSYCMISAVALTRCRSSRCCTPTMMLRW